MAGATTADDKIEQTTTNRSPHVPPRNAEPTRAGAEHCQHDNPTTGQEPIADWSADRSGIDQRTLLRTGCNPLIQAAL
jgi:hypothetical protein